MIRATVSHVLVERRLGAAGMATVFLAGRRVAVVLEGRDAAGKGQCGGSRADGLRAPLADPSTRPGLHGNFRR